MLAFWGPPRTPDPTAYSNSHSAVVRHSVKHPAHCSACVSLALNSATANTTASPTASAKPTLGRNCHRCVIRFSSVVP